MGILDFFRKFRQEKKQKESEKEKIPFSELESWIEKNIKKIEKQEEGIFSLIKKKTEILSEEIREKINAAENFDLNTKKAEDRVKSLTEEGRKKYIESVEYLLNNLKNLKKDRLEKTISEIDRLFSDFSKRSYSSYERATIFIGKEMSSIKETLKDFSSEVIKIFNRNKDLTDFSKTLFLVKLKLKQFEKKDEEIKKCEKEIDLLNDEIKNKEKQREESTEEIEKIKKSREYLEMQEKNEKLKILKNELEKDISNLRQDIDFKALGNFYHIFEDKMNLVKAHIENFNANFHKDSGKTILELIEAAKLPNKNIPEKINKIRNKKEEISNLEAEIGKEKLLEKLNEIYSQITKSLDETRNLKDKKVKEEKKLETFKTEKNEILSRIKENTEKMNVEF